MTSRKLHQAADLVTVPDMTNEERAELEFLEAQPKPRDFKGDTVTPEKRKMLDRLYYLRLRKAGVCTWREAKEQIGKHLDGN